MKKILFILVFSFLLSGCIPKLEMGSNSENNDEYLKGGIVKGFVDLPMYPRVRVVESYGSKGSYGASFVTDDGIDKVIQFYSDSLGALGWESTVRRAGETNVVFDVKNSENEGSVIVNTASDGKKTAITVSVGPR